MAMKYIRDTYNVPAKRGGRIVLVLPTASNDVRLHGTIIGSSGPYLRVRFDDKTRGVGNVHPTWHVEYTEPNGVTNA